MNKLKEKKKVTRSKKKLGREHNGVYYIYKDMARKFKTVIKGHSSAPFPIQSVLGPSFIIFVN